MKRQGICRGANRFWGVAMAVVSALTPAIWGQVPNPIPAPSTPNSATGGFSSLSGYLRAKATPDECWAGLGQNTLWAFVNPSNPAQPCPTGQIPKVDQGGADALALVGNLVFFGTESNGTCLMQSSFSKKPNGPTPYSLSSWACEFASSPYASMYPPQIADFRPARYYAYSLADHSIRDITPTLGGNPGTYCSTSGPNPLCLDNLWMTMHGPQTSTVYTEPQTGRTYVLVGGPGLNQRSGQFLVYFALDITGVTSPSQITNANWVAKYEFQGYRDQHAWINTGGVWYTPSGKAGGGSLLQYTGNFANLPTPPTPNQDDNYNAIPACGTNSNAIPPQGTYVCFAFQSVGEFDGDPTSATIHTENNPNTGQPDPRLFVGTLPGQSSGSIWMSPSIPQGGFGQPSPNPPAWTKVWNVGANYDPDPIVSAVIGTGAVADFNGVLYWGTAAPPIVTSGVWLNYYTPGQILPAIQLKIALVNTTRQLSIFNGANFLSGAPTISLLYGQSSFLVWNGKQGTQGKWVVTPNNMGGVKPVYGTSGFGYTFNAAVSSMVVFNKKLYIATSDWGYPFADLAPLIFRYGIPPNLSKIDPPQSYGGDIWSFANTSSQATAESISGMGNNFNVGVRSMMANGTQSLIIGTGNPMNLATTTAPYGGWELIEGISGSQNKGR